MTQLSKRQENLNVNIEEYKVGKTVLESLPPVLFVELTQNCNSRCLMCSRAEVHPNGYQTNLDMSDDVFNIVKEQLFPFASVADLRGFGESTILKNFDKRVMETVNAGVRVRLVTNALAIKQSSWKLLMENSAMVVVSVDSSTPETMKKLGRGRFDQLEQSLENGVNEREKSNNKGEILFNTVVSSFNLEELADIILLAKKYKIREVIMSPVMVLEKSQLHLCHCKKHDIYKYIFAAQKVAREENVELRLSVSIDEDLVIEEKLLNKCFQPWEHCYIDYAGNIGYCDFLIGRNLILGNIKTSSFNEIWNGEWYQRIRYLHANVKLGERNKLPHFQCKWCYKRRYIDFEDQINMSLQSKVVSSILCDSIIPNI
jgi:radical SAM protein with 4Fe4S-binding SPASM domain